ncbi:cytochrome c oxidase subunit 4 isoform 1, mitochondrial [Lepeophtheirus salmonis]|uniref:Cytochrome c oxidase subunit 4 n=1 Tax=Lepeophtheirus salmonis TaxID=72036 RepID=C1BS23_LEPSM|nr:cytochrome c oxidase subunit 4 isoform 1, mitochondrial-like [Lepeophtheirus salmonis]ACO11826.1 Cytochrome c oxidase subunit 4 isoform 2, mitochondrial precursor [Lepeophtheirus salmonis]
MALRRSLGAQKAWLNVIQRRYMSAGGAASMITRDNTAHLPIQCDIGNREIVGYGMAGEQMYMDYIIAPYPAIRFKEDTPEILALRKKEKGDWNQLSIKEKKELYRASFCQTLAELQAPDGEWKEVTGLVFIFISISIWMYIGASMFFFDELPHTITDPEHMKSQMEKMIANRVNPVTGFTSDYDYEKNEWKKK